MSKLRDEYQQKMEIQIREWRSRIEDLKSRDRELSEREKSKLNERIELLYELEREAWKALEELKGAAEDAWQDYRLPVENALQELRNASQGTFIQTNR